MLFHCSRFSGEIPAESCRPSHGCQFAGVYEALNSQSFARCFRAFFVLCTEFEFVLLFACRL